MRAKEHKCSKHNRNVKNDSDSEKEDMVYAIVNSCVAIYIGLTNGCLNARLREHRSSQNNHRLGAVDVHDSVCSRVLAGQEFLVRIRILAQEKENVGDCENERLVYQRYVTNIDAKGKRVS